MGKKNKKKDNIKDIKNEAVNENNPENPVTPEDPAKSDEVVYEYEEVIEEIPQEPSELDAAWLAAEDFKRKWYAVTAEYENFRKRNAAAVANAYRDGAAESVLKILPVADNFGYAYDMAQDGKT